MSEHDPFDGNYDDTPVEAPAQDAGQSDEQSPTEAPTRETYTRGHLERMRKADLQALARERGLDASGDRDDLIARIEADQG